MSRPKKRYLLLKTFILVCFLGAIVTAFVAHRATTSTTKREVTLTVDSCKYDARANVLSYTYTVTNPGGHDVSALFDVRFVDTARAAVGVDLVIEPLVTPGAKIKGAGVVQPVTKPKGAVACESTLRVNDALRW